MELSRKTINKHSCPEFLLHFQNQQEDSIMMLANIQETWLINNSIVFKLQQACEAKLPFICLVLVQNKRLSLTHRQDYIEGSGQHTSCTLKKSSKDTSFDYLNAGDLLKPLENKSMRLKIILHNNALKVT